MGKGKLNSWFSNILMTIVVWVAIVLGLINILKAVSSLISTDILDLQLTFIIIYTISFLVCSYLFILILKTRRTLS
jgi:hypothetical protein